MNVPEISLFLFKDGYLFFAFVFLDIGLSKIFLLFFCTFSRRLHFQQLALQFRYVFIGKHVLDLQDFDN